MSLALEKPATYAQRHKYREIHNSIIQSVIFQEGLKLQACNLLRINL